MPLLRLEGPKTGRVLKSWLVVTVEEEPNQKRGCNVWIERLNEDGKASAISKLILWTRAEDIPWLIEALNKANEFMENYNAPTRQTQD